MEKDKNNNQPWATPVMWICIVAIVTGGMVFLGKSCLDAPAKTATQLGNQAAKVYDTVKKDLRDLAAAFNSGTVNASFRTYSTTLHTNLYLQVATLKQMEEFTHQNTASTAFGYVPLPDVVVSASAPVEYTYYLDLNDKWEFTLKDNTVYVYPPELKFNKPAFDVSQLNYEVKKDSVLRRTESVKEELKSSLMAYAIQRAKLNKPLVHESARKQVGAFVDQWLMRSFTNAGNYRVEVVFEKERVPKKD